MISESVVCLDRRVSNPPAVEAGGSTTWTLPYPVATDGSQGRVCVVRLDTEADLTVTRPSSTTVRAVGSHSAAPVAVGVAYTWRFVPTTIYKMSNEGKPDRRVSVRLAYVRAFLDGTRHVAGTVSAPDRADCTVELIEASPTEGQSLTLPVFAESKRATLVLTTDKPWPVRIGTMEWEGQYDPNSVTQVP